MIAWLIIATIFLLFVGFTWWNIHKSLVELNALKELAAKEGWRFESERTERGRLIEQRVSAEAEGWYFLARYPAARGQASQGFPHTGMSEFCLQRPALSRGEVVVVSAGGGVRDALFNKVDLLQRMLDSGLGKRVLERQIGAERLDLAAQLRPFKVPAHLRVDVLANTEAASVNFDFISAAIHSWVAAAGQKQQPTISLSDAGVRLSLPGVLRSMSEVKRFIELGRSLGGSIK